MNSNTASQFINLINQRSNILIICHNKPDGDTLGSSLAFAHYLDKIGKKHTHYCIDVPASYYSYLPKIESMKHGEKPDIHKFDLVICFDHGSIHQSGHADDLKRYKESSLETRLVNIDHHFSNEEFGDLNILDFDASSTSEVIYNIFRTCNILIDRNMATCLMTGLIYDTSNFTNSATKESSLSCASHLASCGASIPSINEKVIKTKNIPSLNIWGEVFSRLQINPKYHIAYSIIRKEDLIQEGVNKEALDGMVNFLQGLKDVKAVMLLTEDKDGWLKGSLRTIHDDVDVNALAKLWGGGGHKKASGFKVKAEIMEQEGFWSVK